jgi:CheY-like chemotaxis protein
MASPTPVRILVIDDDPGIVRALVRLLRRDGYTVDTAGNGRHALAQLQVQRYDVILTDLRMPELDGRAFYTHLLQQYPALRQRVIFLTGESGAADTRAFLAQCGQPWLAKPYAIAALCRTCAATRQAAPGTMSAASRAGWGWPARVCHACAMAVSGPPPAQEGPGL